MDKILINQIKSKNTDLIHKDITDNKSVILREELLSFVLTTRG